MPPTRPKKPLSTKAELIAEIIAAVEKRGMTTKQAVEWIASYFTAIDLVGIRDDLSTIDEYLEGQLR